MVGPKKTFVRSACEIVPPQWRRSGVCTVHLTFRAGHVMPTANCVLCLQHSNNY